VSTALGTSDNAGVDLASNIVGLVGQGPKTAVSASVSGKGKRQLSGATGFASSLAKSLSGWGSTHDVAEAEKAWKVLGFVSHTLGASEDAGTKLAGKIISQVDKSVKAGIEAAGSKEKMQLSDLANLASSVASDFAKSGSVDALAEAEKVCRVLTSVCLTLEASPDAGSKVAGKIVGQVEDSLKAAAEAAGIKKRQLSDVPALSDLTGGNSGLSALTGTNSGLSGLTGGVSGLSEISDLVDSSLPDLQII